MIATLCAGALVVIAAVCFLGALFPRVPYLGLGSLVTDVFPTWLLLAAVLGTALALVARTLHRTRLAILLACAGALATVAGVVVCATVIRAFSAAGVDIDVASTLRLEALDTPSDDEITYLMAGGEALKLSVYRPRARTYQRAAPILVYVHGGGWVGGSHRDRSTDMRFFADQGYLVFSVGYSLSNATRHHWNAVQPQVGCALGWIARHAPELDGDPGRIAMIGDSAGGNLVVNSAYIAATGTLPSACAPSPSPRIRAVVAVVPALYTKELATNPYPVIGPAVASMLHSYTGGTPQQYPSRYESFESERFISALAPPTLLLAGESDHLVAADQSRRFAARAEQAGVQVRRVAIPFTNHVFGLASTSYSRQALRQLTLHWLGKHMPTDGR